MPTKPYFSVIIPTLNEEKFLPRLLTDLAHQTSRNFEVIVVDAQSKDATKKVAQSFHDKLPNLTIFDSPKKNVSFQRNFGTQKARGKTFLFIDADTQIPKFFLSGLMYKLSKKPADLFTTWMRADSKNPQDHAIAVLTNISFEIGRLIDLPAGMGSMLGFKKSIFKKLHGFDETIHYAEDQEIVRRAIEKDYKFTIYTDPYFVWSFRRFRQQGTLKSIRQFAKLQAKILNNGYLSSSDVDYPMGGHQFAKDQAEKSTAKKLLSTLFKKKP